MVESLPDSYRSFDDPDKDHRYMAVSDLLTDAQKPMWKAPASVNDTSKLLDAVLKRLDDSSGDVSALAIKW